MSSLHTIKMLVSYDGTDFSGWQLQPGRRTVQGELELALGRVLKAGVKTAAAGRTDAGVHATGQVVSFVTPVVIPGPAWVPAMNSVLGRDVAVWWAEEAAQDFHARHSALCRSYRYTVLVGKPRSPVLARYAAWVGMPLAVEPMREVWSSLLGRHDFSAFMSTGSDPANPVCQVLDARVEEDGDLLHFYITADHFLYNMVRRLVGTVLRVGKGHLDAAGFRDTWLGRASRPSGPTAPSNGLTFIGVGYPERFEWATDRLERNMTGCDPFGRTRRIS